MLTIFTPAYNRAHTLTRLYNSLCSQTCFDFEWVIIDDGSTDNTSELIQGFINNGNQFTIIFQKQENGGKHRAINAGIKLAHGNYFCIVDSDDYLTHDAVFLIEKYTRLIDTVQDCCGIVALKVVIGNGNDSNNSLIINTDFLSYRIKYKQKGDRFEIVKTSIMKAYPFPEFPGEKFCTEAVVWNRIAQKYYARYVDLRIYVCEYLEDGLTKSIQKTLYKNPKSMMLYYKEIIVYDKMFFHRIKNSLNFWRYCFISRTFVRPPFALIYLFFFGGMVIALSDYLKHKTKRI